MSGCISILSWFLEIALKQICVKRLRESRKRKRKIEKILRIELGEKEIIVFVLCIRFYFLFFYFYCANRYVLYAKSEIYESAMSPLITQ